MNKLSMTFCYLKTYFWVPHLDLAHGLFLCYISHSASIVTCKSKSPRCDWAFKAPYNLHWNLSQKHIVFLFQHALLFVPWNCAVLTFPLCQRACWFYVLELVSSHCPHGVGFCFLVLRPLHRLTNCDVFLHLLPVLWLCTLPLPPLLMGPLHGFVCVVGFT